MQLARAMTYCKDLSQRTNIAIGRLIDTMRREGLRDLNEAVQNPGINLSFDVQTELPQEEDLDLISPVVGSIHAVSTGSALLVTGNFKVTCVFECARCADPIEKVVEFTMNDEFEVEGVPSCYGSDGYALVKCEEPFELFDKNALIKDTYVRQGLLVSLPFQPLCEYGWEGDCPNARKLKVSTEKPAGHPAMKALEKFRREDS